jgi:tRNA G18 (ribose-2'-O)-methylase SpoU
LVVVASLVEKIPNLAGLARTCEVLGAERLVLADLGVTKHKDFTSVSVTAEKWLRLDECPIFGLAAYLKRLKREGYALVGLEQTRGAEDVEAHAWHRKTALVLGREREGVDADILGMLDACVVIRQRGMIRSLNVHVSASMAVSRYAAAAALHGWQ